MSYSFNTNYSKTRIIMHKYTHNVQYYETDKMGIVHHSNYVRWMEEARTDFLASIGWNYDRLESLGIVSPVTKIECNYLVPTKYPEKIAIEVRITEFKGVRLKVAYTFFNEEGKKVLSGNSEHCFLNSNGVPVRLKKEQPEFYEAMLSCVESEL